MLAMSRAFRLMTLLSALLPLLVGCVMTLPPPPDAPTPVESPARTIVVVGNGDLRVQANIARINFGIEVVDESVLTANRTASATMQGVLDALAAAEIAERDIKPYAYNIYAERYYEDYERDDPGTVPLFPDPNENIRYRVIHQIYVNVRDFAAIADVLDTLVNAGGANVYIYGTDYLYDDPASLEPEARAKAVADAQRKAEAIAGEIGAELGPVIAISEFVQGSGFTWNNYSPPLWPGQLQFYKQLQFTYAIQGANATLPSPTATSITTTTTVPLSDTVVIHGGDEASLRDYLRYSHLMIFPAIEETHSQIYIGTLPPELPFTMALPEGVSIVGGEISTGEFAGSQLIFRQVGDVAPTVAALRQQLTDQGYRQPPLAQADEIFRTQAEEYVPQCSPDNTHNIIIAGRNLPDGTGVIRYLIYTAVPGNNLCAPVATAERINSGEFDGAMPNLSPPANVATYQSGMSSTNDAMEATITFVGDTEIAALVEHYTAQLAGQAWQPLTASQTEEMAWSSWSLDAGGQHYIATFYIVRLGESDNRFQATFHLQLTQ